jgi:hypothetical protein
MSARRPAFSLRKGWISLAWWIRALSNTITIFPVGVFPQRPLQKTEEGRCVVCPFFRTNDPTGFIIQGADQFHPFVLSVSGDFPLVAAEKPGAANGLVIPDHGFVLEQEVVNVAIQQLMHP